MPAPEHEDSRNAREPSDGLAADIRELLVLVRLRFLLVETRVARLEHRAAPPSAEPPRRCCRRPRRPGPGPATGGACPDLVPPP